MIMYLFPNICFRSLLVFTLCIVGAVKADLLHDFAWLISTQTSVSLSLSPSF